MTTSASFSPSPPSVVTGPMALAAGLIARVVPEPLVEGGLAAILGVMRRRHDGVFSRLGGLAGSVIVIDPVDLPVALALDFSAGEPALRLARRGDMVAATVRAPLVTLVALMEGRLDGDALFFSRDLVVEGDAEVVVTLRNAIDAEEIDLLEDLGAFLGPLAPAAARFARGAAAVTAAATRDLEAVGSVLFSMVLSRALPGSAPESHMPESHMPEPVGPEPVGPEPRAPEPVGPR